MFKNFIISLLSAALIQPIWSCCSKPWDYIFTFCLTTFVVFIAICDLQEKVETLKY